MKKRNIREEQAVEQHYRFDHVHNSLSLMLKHSLSTTPLTTLTSYFLVDVPILKARPHRGDLRKYIQPSVKNTVHNIPGGKEKMQVVGVICNENRRHLLLRRIL